MTLLPSKYARCPRHIAPATCDTCVKKKKDSGNTPSKTSIHHVTHALNKQRCERSCASCSKLATRGTQIDARNRNRRHERCSRAPQHDGSLASGSLRQPPHEPPRRNTTSHTKKHHREEPNVTCFRSAPRPCVCTYSPKWRLRAQSERARQSTRAPFSARHNEHGDVEANEQGAQSNARRHSTTQKTVQRRKSTSSPEDQDSQFRCARMARRPNSHTPCLFQAIVKCSCLAILWQS